ncbi:NUDIX domain-containing protein [uncultured Amnibacterium sp.]|uniref:NUDIX hydrolase n=1 Tax=uncultured Amnibacterium sp. TaxID=1631851 RepID=UPI0035CAF4E1
MPEQPVTVAVSTVIFGLRGVDGEPVLHLPLVQRVRQPHLGRWALPGGPLRADESLRDAARRSLADTTGLDPAHLEQLYTFGAVDRGAADRVVSVVYWALVRTEEAERTPDDPHVAWFPAERLPLLAFDHDEIVGWAVKRLKAKLEYTHLSHALLPDEFTLGQLREVHEAILGRRLDPANFRRRVEATGTVAPTGAHQAGVRHRPPALYRSTAREELLT